VRKVDTHVHHSAAMNAKHLCRFMKYKLKHCSAEIVDVAKDGSPVPLGKVFAARNVEWDNVTIDKLQVWADKTCMHRFDRFNNKYSPMGENSLRGVFLKTDNHMGGRYLAEITEELLSDLEDTKYQHVEWRLSIYGKKRDEWENLSRWVLGEGKGLGQGRALLSDKVRWMIQIPRLFNVYQQTNALANFGQMLENIFVPLVEATLNPDEHKNIARFLENLSGFDTVDDESKIEFHAIADRKTPYDWNVPDNPSYAYYSYFIQANIRILNGLRATKGMNQFSYRPHAGEAGDVKHLDVAFLLADGINHGLNLRQSPSLQYLYYLGKIGIAMSPCSNNQLFLEYEQNPFPMYFKRGLNVSLSSDDPLMFHQTKEALMEEYSIAKQIWHFSSADLCEIARNSVLQSGFPDDVKASWLGTKDFHKVNVPNSTNVPGVRFEYRQQVWQDELRIITGIFSEADEQKFMQKLLRMSNSGSPKVALGASSLAAPPSLSNLSAAMSPVSSMKAVASWASLGGRHAQGHDEARQNAEVVPRGVCRMPSRREVLTQQLEPTRTSDSPGFSTILVAMIAASAGASLALLLMHAKRRQ
jgi:AMP deaminase